jgi:hypothetical protein
MLRKVPVNRSFDMKLKAEANLLLLLCIMHLVFDVEVCSPLLIANHTPKLSLRQRMVNVQGNFCPTRA